MFESLDFRGGLGLLLDATVRATVLLTVAWLADRMLRRSSAAVRHRVWASVLIGLLTLPVLSRLLPGWSLPVLPNDPRVGAASSPPVPVLTPKAVIATRGAVATPAAVETIVRPEPPRQVAPSITRGVNISRETTKVTTPWSAAPPVPRSWTVEGVVLGLWAAGVLATLTPTLIGLAAGEIRRARAKPIDDGDWLDLIWQLRHQYAFRRRLDLRWGDATLIPLTWGVLRPVILLPDSARSWPEARRRAVLLHELAHVERLDVLTLLLGRVAAALYWFHPLAWHALRRLRTECEHACDDRVVAAGERPADYAQQLLDLARGLRVPRWSVAVALSRRSTLEERMIALFDEARSHRPLDRPTARRLLAAGCAAIVGLALIQPRPGAVAESVAVVPISRTHAALSDTPSPAPPAAEGTGRIAGRVRDDRGEAAAGAEVLLLFPPPGGAEYYIGTYPIRRMKADATGMFAFDKLPPGKYRVWAQLGRLTSRRKRSGGEVVVAGEAG